MIFIFLFLFFLSGVTTFADNLLPPTFLTAKSDQDVKVPLFWFSPHPDTSELAYHGNGMLYGMYVVPPWHENCVAVRMSAPSFPFYLLKSKIYISHHGAGIDTNYNYKTPFFVSVNPDSGGIPRNLFLDSVSVNATGEDSLADGEWVDAEHNLLMEDSTFWIVFHWYEDTPFSPLVGVDSLMNVGNSLCGKRTFFHFEWQKKEHNFMIGAQVVTASDTASGADRFRVYRSTDSTVLIDQSNLIASVSGSQFQYTDLNVFEDQTYFYRITSVNSPEESQGSNLAEATPQREAKLVADKKDFFINCSSGGQIHDSLTLTNSGGLPLWFKLQINMEESGWMGGSDPFGYTWTDNHRQPGLEFTWADIQNWGISIGDIGDNDQDYGFFPLEFSFPFYGNAFDSIRIASDGWLSFSPVIPCYTDTFKCYINKCLPFLWGPYDLLAPFWDDLVLTDSSAMYFFSNNDSAIISFLNFYHYSQAGGGPYTFQIILTPDGEISFQYCHIPDPKYSATVGIQNKDGTIGLGIFCNQDSLQDSLLIKIRPGWVKADSMEGCIQPGESKTLNLTFNPLSYPRGVYNANLLVDSWDKNHRLETRIIPLTLGIDTTIDPPTSVDGIDSERPEKIALLQNFPNPFNPVTSIRYTIHSSQRKAVDGTPFTVHSPIPTTQVKAVHGSQFAVHGPIPTTLIIYNVLGQKVRTLVDEPKSDGDYEVVWEGKDDKGKEVASGIYFCKLTVGPYQKLRKMVLLK